jgi:hypothetical protein
VTTAPGPRQYPQALREAWPQLLAVFGAVLGLYAATAPRTVALEDDGLFIMAVEFLGIAHPSGYPLYVLLAKPFTLLPIGSVAFRVHLASGFFGAAACSVLWWIVRRLIPRAGYAWVAAGAFAVSEVMWSQAIIADVYTLNLLLFLLLFALSLAYLEAPRRARLAALGLVYGLALSNHHPLTLLATPCLALLLWPRRGPLLRDAWVALPGLLVGLTPYLWMVWRSRADPMVSFYGPIRDLRDFAYYVSRRGYSEIETSASASGWDRLRFAGFLLRESVHQYGVVGALLAAGGFGLQLRRERPSWSLALLAGYLSGGLVLVLLLDFDYQLLQRLIFRVFPLIPYAIMALCLALGLRGVVEVLVEMLGEARHGIAESVVFALAALLVVALALANLPRNDRRGYDFATDYATTLLESLPPDAVAFTQADADAFPMGYLHLVEGIRPDLTLYNADGLVFASRLIHARADAVSKQRAVRDFVRASRRPVYFMGLRPDGWASEDYGFYSRIDPSGPVDRHRSALRPELLALALRMAEQPEDMDPWSRALANSQLATFSAVLAQQLADEGDPQRAARYRADLDLLRAHFHGIYGWLNWALAQEEMEPEPVLEWVMRAEALAGDHVSKLEHASLQRVKANLLLQLGREDEAAQCLVHSVELYPVLENPAIVGLMEILARSGRRDEYLVLRERFFSNRIGPPELRKLDRQVGQ